MQSVLLRQVPGRCEAVSLTIKKMSKATPVPYIERVMGLDVSTRTGFVVLSRDPSARRWVTVMATELKLPTLPDTSSMVQRLKRVQLLQVMIAYRLQDYCPGVVAIEGYAFGHVQSQVMLVELGTVVRSAMLDYATTHSMTPLEVAPAQLKKFVLDKGVGRKEQVMMGVYKRWGFEAETNNIADAYVLAQIAAARQDMTASIKGGNFGLTKPQMEVMKAVSEKNA